MYEAFDSFLRRNNSHTLHALDEEGFFRALDTVVRDPQFNADRFGEYVDQKRENGDSAQANLTSEAYEHARDHYVAAAWAVHTYLRTTGQC